MRADVYRKAAELLEAEPSIGFACVALCTVLDELGMGGQREKYEELFALYFKPPYRCRNDSWFGRWFIPANRERRITALLLMAAIVEGGDA